MCLVRYPIASIFQTNEMCANLHCGLKSLATMPDPIKLIERAEKLLEKGKPELALAEYRAAIELQPENDALLQKAADLSISIGQLGLASDLLRRLFPIPWRISSSAMLPWSSASCSG